MNTCTRTIGDCISNVRFGFQASKVSQAIIILSLSTEQSCSDSEIDMGHCLKLYLSPVMKKPTFWFLTRSDTNQAVQSQKMARGLKFRI